jgi:hypothetical protein
MKFTVKFANEAIPAEVIEADGVQLQAPGVVLLHKENQVVALFPLPSLAGVFTLEGPNQIIPVQVSL